jgi:hypothetical protein
MKRVENDRLSCVVAAAMALDGSVFRALLITFLLSGWVSGEPLQAIGSPTKSWRLAPNPDAKPCDQLSVSGNACGPAALINAYRFGDKNWQRVGNSLERETDREQIMHLIQSIGLRSSASFPGRARWTRRGISVVDLREIGDEMAQANRLPKLRDEMLFLMPDETPEKLLQRTHRRLEKSLAKGLPPVLSLSRHVLRRASGADPAWIVVDSHFVTLIAIPRRLERGGRSFPVRYVDPWRGSIGEGWIQIPEQPQLVNQLGSSPFLEASFPAARVGRDKIRNGETTILALAAVIGRW